MVPPWWKTVPPDASCCSLNSNSAIWRSCRSDRGSFGLFAKVQDPKRKINKEINLQKNSWLDVLLLERILTVMIGKFSTLAILEIRLLLVAHRQALLGPYNPSYKKCLFKKKNCWQFSIWRFTKKTYSWICRFDAWKKWSKIANLKWWWKMVKISSHGITIRTKLPNKSKSPYTGLLCSPYITG